MHEFSVVMSIVDIVSSELQKAEASEVEEIELDIGELSGIDISSFDFAWQQAVRQTPLERAVRKVNRIEGQARCLQCDVRFPVQQLYDACPVCNGHLIDVLQGRELRVKSLLVN